SNTSSGNSISIPCPYTIDSISTTGTISCPSILVIKPSAFSILLIGYFVIATSTLWPDKATKFCPLGLTVYVLYVSEFETTNEAPLDPSYLPTSLVTLCSMIFTTRPSWLSPRVESSNVHKTVSPSSAPLTSFGGMNTSSNPSSSGRKNANPRLCIESVPLTTLDAISLTYLFFFVRRRISDSSRETKALISALKSSAS